jgi:hypothetical protein
MFNYSAPDRATRVGYIIGDAFLVAFAIFMFFGLFLSR